MRADKRAISTAAGIFYGRLDALNEFKFDFSMERVKKALRLKGDPQNSFYCIHVTGSNGKGSVTLFLANILAAHGFKTGAYTSPHFTDVKERIAINGKKIGGYIFASEGVRLFELLDKNKIRLTYFEFLTVLAFVIFRREKVSAAVVEVGLGGRYDATNVNYKKKLLSIITSISLEHTDILGNTEMKILKEKAAIIGKGDAVVNIPQKELKAYMKSEFGPRVKFADECFPALSAKPRKKGLLAAYKIGNFTTKMIEPVQAKNISTVLTALGVLERKGFEFDIKRIKKAILRTYLPGRMSWNKKGYYLSIAHNPAAFKAVLETLSGLFPGRKITYVFSALKDKDINSIFKAASAYKNISFILTAINNPRAISIAKLEEIIVRYGIKYRVEPDNYKALEAAKKQNGIVVAGGSFYLVNKFI
jgi:dihydrofolate synthase/folylpolyglutamate synthase